SRRSRCHCRNGSPWFSSFAALRGTIGRSATSRETALTGCTGLAIRVLPFAEIGNPRQGCHIMRHGQARLLGLLTALLAGCATGKVPHAVTWLDHLRPFQGPTGPDVVSMQVALIERPVGDPYLNHELWAGADEQAIPLERKVVLEDNGLRVGQIGGIAPAKLLALLTSEKSCINPRCLQF